ncbi:hypothetical protein LCM10_05230 [Rossellomorea aquimaris]|uniref:hypothetical protein n=1 Tax=Rossellomorea aquimaris TaxID=189382 RepID=UPI001CD2AD77|nr:hypothetical protein [Rossellomorea aquimaris]MCA1054381.1 hypothetical protein [Rossellomorea aquimaris]
MMTRRKKGILLGIVLIPLAGILSIYWFFFTSPASLPGDDEMMDKINVTLPAAGAIEIQDAVLIDERNATVFFKSKTGTYGVSNWVWKKRKWRLAVVHTKGEPRIWKIEPGDPSTYRIIWNIDPKARLATLNFYLKKDRYYSISGDRHRYDPAIQMKKEMLFEGHENGVMKLPDDWAYVMETLVEGGRNSGFSLFDDFVQQPYLAFGWLPLDEQGEEKLPGNAVNGNSFHSIGTEEEHVPLLNKREVE